MASNSARCASAATFGLLKGEVVELSDAVCRVAGARAQYKGEGTINGDPGYCFMLPGIGGQGLGLPWATATRLTNRPLDGTGRP